MRMYLLMLVACIAYVLGDASLEVVHHVEMFSTAYHDALAAIAE